MNEDVLLTIPEDRIKVEISLVTTEEHTPSFHYQKQYEELSEWARKRVLTDERGVTELSSHKLRPEASLSILISDYKDHDKFQDYEDYQLKATLSATTYRGDNESMKNRVEAYNEIAEGYVSYSDATFKVFQTEDDLQRYQLQQSRNSNVGFNEDNSSVSNTETTEEYSFRNTHVRTRANLNVRMSPGGRLITQVPFGTTGKTLGPANVENGNYWWREVRFDNGVEGYVANSFLVTDGPDAPSAVSTERQVDTLTQIQSLLKMVEVLQERLRTLEAS